MASNKSVLIEIGQGLFLKPGLPTIVAWKTEDRPKKVKRGTFGFNTQTNQLEYFDGEGWLAAEMDKA